MTDRRPMRPPTLLHCMLALLMLCGAMAVRANELVLIVHPSVNVPSRDELAEIYLGASAMLTPLDYADDAAIRADFYRRLVNREPAQLRAEWARLVFTGRGRPPRVLASAAAVKRSVAADPRLVGYIERRDLDASVKLALALD